MLTRQLFFPENEHETHFSYQKKRVCEIRLVDRRFYRRKYDAEKTLAAFNATLRNEVDLNELPYHLLVIIQETMQPTHLSLWIRPLKHQTSMQSARLHFSNFPK
jgi:hypothetical protein